MGSLILRILKRVKTVQFPSQAGGQVRVEILLQYGGVCYNIRATRFSFQSIQSKLSIIVLRKMTSFQSDIVTVETFNGQVKGGGKACWGGP